jgi:hypothetical protein
MTSMQASGVLDTLEKTLFRAPAHGLLREVRNSTGFTKITRSADAIVVSLWPSRGIWFAGVEVKVSRSDLLKELRDPAKSAEIQRYCDYWWLATPAGLAKIAELPETWGLVEVTGTKYKIKKHAPRLKAEPLSTGFVAAVLRNRAEYEAALRQDAQTETWKRAQEEFGAQSVEHLKGDVASYKARAEQHQRRCQQLESSIADFERASGVTIRAWNGGHYGETFRLALQLRDREFRNLITQMSDLAVQLGNLERDAKEPPALPATTRAKLHGASWEVPGTATIPIGDPR